MMYSHLIRLSKISHYHAKMPQRLHGLYKSTQEKVDLIKGLLKDSTDSDLCMDQDETDEGPAESLTAPVQRLKVKLHEIKMIELVASSVDRRSLEMGILIRNNELCRTNDIDDAFFTDEA